MIVTGVVAIEALAWGDLATTLQVLAPNLVALPVMLSGTEAQQGAMLPQFCEAKPPAVTAALTEPAIQFDPRRLKTTAVLDGGTLAMADGGAVDAVYYSFTAASEAAAATTVRDGRTVVLEP